mmetsp:Transcript_33008/g.102415  ORF Transcript_33008/g.102415 Transcript_33008/m.102415 type:complete len:254 (+) Transcript_33008:144-905(+)
MRDALAELRIAPLEHVGQAARVLCLLAQAAVHRARLVPHAVEHDVEPLHGAGAHELHGQVDAALVPREQPGIDESHAVGQPLNLVAERPLRHRLQDEANLGGIPAGDAVPRDEQPLCPLRAGVVHEHVRGQHPKVPGGWEADLRVLRGHDNVGEEGDANATCQAIAVDRHNHWLVHIEDRHLEPLLLLHIPDVILDLSSHAYLLLPLPGGLLVKSVVLDDALLQPVRSIDRRILQVEACAEVPPSPTDNHTMD